jgi:cysteine desulfurase
MKSSRLIYLDNNATATLDPAVVAAMEPYLGGFAGNPSSRHALGRVARRAIDEAREKIAAAIHCQPDEIVFTSGATESNNLAILGSREPASDVVLVNATEHPSALEPTVELHRRSGRRVELLPVDESGLLREIPGRLASAAGLAVVQWANSETGAVQDVVGLRNDLPSRCRLHVDATQAIGRISVDFQPLAPATLSFSGHKIHGPQGVGALVVSRGVELAPLFAGGGQQASVRSGTEPVALIAGLGRAVEIACASLSETAARMRQLRDELESGLAAAVDGFHRNGPIEQRLPNTANISFPGADAQALLMSLDLSGVCASSGTACASGSFEPSRVLQAMGVEGERLRSAVRFSLGRFTTREEVDAAVRRIRDAVQRVRAAVRPA